MGDCKDGKCFEANILIFLKKILASINNGSTEPINIKDIEVQVVKDSEEMMWLEVRNFDIETGTHTIRYFRPGENIHGTPVFPITYPELDITPIINAISAVNDNVEEANQYLDQIKYNTNQTNNKLDQISLDINQSNNILNQIDSDINQTNNKLDLTNDKLDQIDSRIDLSNDILDQVSLNTNQTNTKLDLSNTKLDQVSLNTGQTNNKIDQTNNKLDQVNINIDLTNDTLDNTNSYLDQIDLGIDLLNDLFNNAAVASTFSIQSITTPGTTTLTGFRSGSILFEGIGGKVNGIEVLNRYVLEISGGDLSEIISGIILTTPTLADPDNPLSPRILITKLI